MHLQVATSGETIGGSRYRTLGRLGSGGMADLDLAVQTGVGGSSRLCVLKRVRKDLAGRADFVRMFFEEARISASLSHPNIVQVYEVGGSEQDCFLALELLRGRSYAHLQRLQVPGTQAFRVDLEVLLGTLAGLEHAHQRCDLSGAPMSLIHRDISPPNVVVTYDGEIKLLDFGVAKARDSLVTTEAGMLKGKVAYMAPEMVAGRAYDARVDLYAVGVMLWEAVAGHDRWPGMNDVAILAQLVRGPVAEAPGARARGLPALAERICAQALAADPDKRYQSAAALRADLVRLSDELGGRLGQPELRDYMELHFGAERRREQREIDAARRAQRVTPAAAAPADTDESGFTKRVKRPSPSGTPAISATPTTPAAVADAPSPQGRGRVWAAVALGSLGAALALKLLAPGSAPSDPSAAADAGQRVEVPKEEPREPTAAGSALPTSTPSAAPLVAAPVKARAPKAGQAPATKATDRKPAAPRSLQVDRQDPWN